MLYCKREEDLEEFRLPEHLRGHQRRPLVSHPQEVLEKSPMSAPAFSCFLHQNYLGFFSRVEDLAAAAEQLSLAETFFEEWTVNLSLLVGPVYIYT